MSQEPKIKLPKPPKSNPLTVIEEHTMFFQAHSEGIFYFSQVEEILAQTITLWSDEAEGKILFNAFYGIDTFRARLEFADRYVKNRIGVENKEALKPWKRAHEKCQQAAEARNKLAHWYMRHFSAEKPGMRVVIVPPEFNPSSTWALDKRTEQTGLAPGYAIGIMQVKEMHKVLIRAFLALLALRGIAKEQEDTYEVMLQATTGAPQDLKLVTATFRSMQENMMLIAFS